ncbi:HDIG domain-containing protein [Planctomycetales bacterium]|nr:HDIG domain-containing protein [Planctomycetales bacterium]
MQVSFTVPQKIEKILALLLANGAAECLFVGGFVRDLLLNNLPNRNGTDNVNYKDIDIEVYGLTYEKIAAVLRPHFHVGLVGQSFAVIKIDNEIDINLPRTDSKTGTGHKGFEVSSNPNLSPEEAFARRDFTINAIGLRMDGTVFDPFDGCGDLQRKILRAPTEAFCEDPLRVLRGMQFAARLGFEMESATAELCKRVLPEFKTLSAERVWSEWEKWALKGKHPSKGLQLLKQTGWISCFPEIEALDGCPQNPHWHPEGDVFVHTCFVCDEAAEIAAAKDNGGEQLNDEDRTVLLLAALCHDFGKPQATVLNSKGQWSSRGHAAISAGLAEKFLMRMKPPLRVVKRVVPLVSEHSIFREELSERAVRRLSVRLKKASIRLLAELCRADGRGNGNPDDREETVIQWLKVAEKLGVLDNAPKMILQGRDLLPLGIEAGRGMGNILNNAYEAQLDGEFYDLDGALHWLEKTQML